MKPLALFTLLPLLLAAPAAGQSLYGLDGSSASVWEFTLAPGPPCNQPNPFVLPCGYSVPAPCPNPPPPPGQIGGPPNEVGDIAVDSLTDTYFVTDGLVIEEYQARGPCGTPPPCTPINAFTQPFIGPITGMGMDERGLLLGVRTLWITDGIALAGILPSAPGTCGPPVLLFGPCILPTPGFVGDVTFDPATLSLWACDFTGTITNVLITGGTCVAGISFPPTTCGLGAQLTGIAYDLATPDAVTGAPGALFVTDGFIVESIDVNGAPAVPTFYAPVPCSPTPAPLNGLAYNANAITYGQPKLAATLTGFGQSSSAGPTFGIELTGSPAGATPYLIFNFNVPGPGYLCPPKMGVGTLFWVDPSPPAIILALPPLPPSCVPIPLAIPGGVPPGVQGFMQVIYIAGGPPAVDSTNALAFTIGAN